MILGKRAVVCGVAALFFTFAGCGANATEPGDSVDAAVNINPIHPDDAQVVDVASTVDVRVVDGNTVDGRLVDASTVDGRTVDASTVDGRVVDASTVDGRVVDASTVDGSGVLSGVGGACTAPNSCNGGASAVCINWPGGYCSVSSCSEGTCPTGSDCYQLSSNQSRCLATCTTKADCRAGYACHSLGACVPACTANSCASGEVCAASGLCQSATSCVTTGCPTGQTCDVSSGMCAMDVTGGPGAGPGPTCASLPVRDCTGGEAVCGQILPFTPVTGPGYDNYPLNGETLSNQYRSFARKSLIQLIQYSAAYVDCKAKMWTGGNGQPIALGDMSEANGAIPGTSIGSPGHPAGTHVNGFDMDIGYYQQLPPNNYLRPICPYVANGVDQNHCIGAPTNLDVWKTALFVGAALTSSKVRVIGMDGQVGPTVIRAMNTLCANGWLPQASCTAAASKVVFETTNMNLGWYYFHHHHFHISTKQ